VAAVVDQGVDVEPGDQRRRQRIEQVGTGQCAGVRRVELPGQVVGEHQPAALRGRAHRGLTGEQLLGPGQELDEVLRSLRHGVSSCWSGSSQR
jgi:hypothetical protein